MLLLQKLEESRKKKVHNNHVDSEKSSEIVRESNRPAISAACNIDTEIKKINSSDKLKTTTIVYDGEFSEANRKWWHFLICL
jgi:hypothetical protein